MGLRKRPYNDDKKGGGNAPRKSAGPRSRSEESGKGGFKPAAKRSFNKSNDDSDRPSKRFSAGSEGRKPAGKSTGFKRKEDGFERGPSRYGNDGEKRTPAKRTGGFKRNEDSFDRKPKRFGDDSGERRTPAKRAGGFKRSEDSFDRKPKRFGDDSGERRTPAKRAGGFKRSEDGFDRKPKRFGDEGSERRTPAKRAGGFERRPNLFGSDERRTPGKSTRSSSRDENNYGAKRFSNEDHNEGERRPRVSRSGKPYMVKGAKARDIKAKSEEMLETLIPEEIRLNRYISNSGICSRREADDLIAAGLVAVNGTIVTEMGYKVKPGDEVRYNNERLSWEKKVYLLMNKPKDSITTSDDPEGRKIIMDLIKDPRLPRVYPVGRLDRNTTGVILLTNDGELAQRLTHPKYNISKVYKATLNKSFAAKDMQELANNGVELEDGPIRPDVVGIPSANEKDVVMVQIHSGRNRIIHRMFEAMGYLVDKLDRLDFAGLERKGLDRGEWRHLDDKEIKKLKKLVQLK